MPLRMLAGAPTIRTMVNACYLIALAVLAAPKVGEMAPTFAAKDCDGRRVDLAELRSRGPVVLAFFPKSNTPGCTRELTSYKEMSPTLLAPGAQVVAISADDAATMRAFRDQLGATFLFVPDPNGEIIRRFDVRQWPTNMARRVTFLVHPDGHIVRVDKGSAAVDPTAVLNATHEACPSTPALPAQG